MDIKLTKRCKNLMDTRQSQIKFILSNWDKINSIDIPKSNALKYPSEILADMPDCVIEYIYDLLSN